MKKSLLANTGRRCLIKFLRGQVFLSCLAKDRVPRSGSTSCDKIDTGLKMLLHSVDAVALAFYGRADATWQPCTWTWCYLGGWIRWRASGLASPILICFWLRMHWQATNTHSISMRGRWYWDAHCTNLSHTNWLNTAQIQIQIHKNTNTNTNVEYLSNLHSVKCAAWYLYLWI